VICLEGSARYLEYGWTGPGDFINGTLRLVHTKQLNR
jgi:hypothetical protein